MTKTDQTATAGLAGPIVYHVSVLRRVLATPANRHQPVNQMSVDFQLDVMPPNSVHDLERGAL